MRKRRYRITELLGRGGFGSVYKAEKLGEEGFSTIVAIKLLHAIGGGSNPEVEKARTDAVRRLRDEARLLGLLKHRSIVQVFDLELLRGEWAIVMEYVEGMQLAELAGQTRLPVRQALSIVEEVADALYTAYHFRPHGHELHLLHRDIKPSNVMITKGGSVKVLDFGIARANFEARESRTAGFLIGTQRYMSPEHLDYDDDTIQVGPESDIYSLGAVLFELVAGQPFGRASLDPLGHQDKVVAQLDEHVLGRVPRGLYDLLKRMLSYSPAERPTSRELRSACEHLQQELRGESLRSWCERVVGPLLRNRQRTPSPSKDPIVGSVLEEGEIPKDAYLDAYDRTVAAKPPPSTYDDGSTWGDTPHATLAPAEAPRTPASPSVTPGYTPTAPVPSPGAIALDGERDAPVHAPVGIDSPIDGPDEGPAGGVGIAIDGESPYDDRAPRRARQKDSGDGAGARRLVLLGGGLGALTMVAAGIWVLSFVLDKMEQRESEVEAAPAAVVAAEQAESPEPGEQPADEAEVVQAEPADAAAERQAVRTAQPDHVAGSRQADAPRPSSGPAPERQPVAATPPVEATRPEPSPEASSHDASALEQAAAPPTDAQPEPEAAPASNDARLAAIAALRGGAEPGVETPDAPSDEEAAGEGLALADAVGALTEQVSPEPEAPPAAPAPGSYRVQGNALEVFLKSAGKRFEPGVALDAGRYDIWARFDKSPGAAAIRVGVARIEPGATVTIDCDASMTLCRAL